MEYANSQVAKQSPPQVMTGVVRLVYAKLVSGGRLIVGFLIGDADSAAYRTAVVSPRALESFPAFRRLVLSQCGCWARHRAELGGRKGKQFWLDEVGHAFETDARIEAAGQTQTAIRPRGLDYANN